MTGSDDARALVESYLGRPVQDALEAAVVLEAWGGMPAQASLPMGASAALGRPSVDAPLAPAVIAAPRTDWAAIGSDVAFIVAVLVAGFWVSGRADTFTSTAIDHAWRLALPLSLGSQWFLRRRVFMGPDGIGRLRSEWLLVVPFAGLAIGTALVPGGGLLASELFVLWVAGFVVCRRGWGVPYGAALVVILALDASPDRASIALGSVTLATLIVAAVAVWTHASSPRLPGALARALTAGFVGAGMGMFLVAEPIFSWSASGVLSALTVVPSLLGSLVGGVWMTRLWVVVPGGMRSVPAEPTSRRLRNPALRLYLEAAGLVLVVASVASALVVVVEHDQMGVDGLGATRRLLAAHAALALAGLSVSVLEALGASIAALLAVWCGAGFAMGMHAFGADPLPGGRIFSGALVTVVLSVPALAALLTHPEHRIVAAT